LVVLARVVLSRVVRVVVTRMLDARPFENLRDQRLLDPSCREIRATPPCGHNKTASRVSPTGPMRSELGGATRARRAALESATLVFAQSAPHSGVL
jgi:hypothetical protein